MNRERIASLIILVLLMGGCGGIALKNQPLNGGTTKPAGYRVPAKVITYEADGSVPWGTTVHLVNTGQRLAVMEERSGGPHALFQRYWHNEEGGHFAGWYDNGPAIIYVIPDNRDEPAKRYVYAQGNYRLIDGVTRPVPVYEKDEPDALLYPQ